MAWHDLTLRDIAKATDHALSTVGTWKNGRLPASTATLDRLAALFHVPSQYLLTGEVIRADFTADDAASRILADLEILARALEHSE